MPPAAPSPCPTCGDPMSDASPTGGHCPRCLFRIAFDESTESPAEEETAAWTRFSGLDLYEEIGRGGMGVVYRARQTALNRIVAVKVLLRARFAGAEERGRFHREAQAAARLRHPAIVGIFDVGETEGVPWFSMEYIAGESLEQRVREHPMESREAARLLREIASALQHAHDHGVLHRDLKPSNILLDHDHFPHVSDFGIARITTSGNSLHELTRTGQTLGSPGYVAPEQAFEGKADARTDVYGLGALLYHLLTGRPPFQGATLESIFTQLRENDPLSPRKLNPSIPRELETICLYCLRKSPERRYPNAISLANDLDRFLTGNPIQARPLGWLGVTYRWARRHPAMASMLALIGLLASGILVGSVAFARHTALAEHRTSLVSEARSLRQSRVDRGSDEALKKLREAWAIAPSAEIRHEATACLALPNIGPIGPVSASAPDATQSSDRCYVAGFSGNDIIVREFATGRETARLSNQNPGSIMKLDDHARRLAIADPESSLMRVFSLEDQRLLATCPHPMKLHAIDWSGDLIATSCENRFIYIWGDQGDLKHRLSGHESIPIRIAFRPGSQELASATSDRYGRLWHAARGSEILRFNTSMKDPAALWWSADGSQLFTSTPDGAVGASPVSHSSCLEVLAPAQDELHSENLGSADLSPDGRFAVVIDEHTSRLWDFKTGKLIDQHPKAANQWLSARFSSDGKDLLFCGWAEGLTSRPIMQDANGAVTLGPSVTLLPENGHLLRDSTADGSRIVLSNNGLGCCLVISQDRSPPVRIFQSGILEATISPEGSRLITSSYLETGAKVWTLPEGRLLHTLCKGETVLQICWVGGQRIIVRTSAGIRQFQANNWTEEPSLTLQVGSNAMTTSRDGRLLAILSDNDIRIFETNRYTERLRLTPPAHVGWLGECHLVFDADSTHLLVHTALGSVMRWNLKQIEIELTHLGMPYPEADSE